MVSLLASCWLCRPGGGPRPPARAAVRPVQSTPRHVNMSVLVSPTARPLSLSPLRPAPSFSPARADPARREKTKTPAATPGARSRVKQSRPALPHCIKQALRGSSAPRLRASTRDPHSELWSMSLHQSSRHSSADPAAKHAAAASSSSSAPASSRSRKQQVLANFKSISRRKKTASSSSSSPSPSSSAVPPISHPLPSRASTHRQPQKPSSTPTPQPALSIPSTETFSNLAQLSSNPALRTRNPARKRHSVILHSVTEQESRKNSDLHNPLYVGRTARHTRSTSSLGDLNHSNDDENDSDLTDDELDIVHVSQDSDTILNDLEMDAAAPASHASSNKNHTNTLNNAFSSYSSQISTISTSTSAQASLSSQMSSSNSTSNSPASISRQKYHPLRKLVISSPNNPATSTFSSNTTTSSIKNRGVNRQLSVSSSSQSPSPSPSPYRRLDPLDIQNRSRQNTLPYRSSPTPARVSMAPSPVPVQIPSLHIFKPDLSHEKPHIVPVSNCLFFETLKPQSIISPAKPSQTLATDVFDDSDDSPIKKKSYDYQHIHYKHQNTLLSTFATGLVDPDLFSTNASSVFSGPKTLPSRRRTSLYFV